MGKKISLIEAAAALIRAGQLVAFPTETVYGLGANALDAPAVDCIFAAKGRPATSPLIVHVDSVEMARRVVREWPEAAAKLAARFWPGPLTLVLPKSETIPAKVTAGLDTVGVRIPRHPIALALIREAGVPIAAPSANRFTGISPTTAEHVRKSFGGQVAMVLDGGPAEVGLESTVVSLVGESPAVLRHGMIAVAELEEMLGPVRVFKGPVEGHPSPGMHPRHYSPRTPLLFQIPKEGRGVFLYLAAPAEGVRSIRMPSDPRKYAAVLYRTMHEQDDAGWDWIALERPPRKPEWTAILDRLERAAHR